MTDVTSVKSDASIMASIIAALTRRVGVLLASFDAALVPLDNDVDQMA